MAFAERYCSWSSMGAASTAANNAARNETGKTKLIGGFWNVNLNRLSSSLHEYHSLSQSTSGDSLRLPLYSLRAALHSALQSALQPTSQT